MKTPTPQEILEYAHQENLARLRRILRTTVDEGERKRVLKLLAEEEAQRQIDSEQR
jgi:hypothetical protein